MKQKILLVAHCFLNDAAKLKNQDPQEQQNERRQKRTLLQQLLDHDVEFLQLPCPEFILYGCNRWGHSASQFNTPHFKKQCTSMLDSILMQLEEYFHYPDRYEVLGVLGINGSPSCGIDYTYDGDWGGEFNSNPNLPSTLASIKKEYYSGIFMEVLKNLLDEKGFHLPFYSYETFQIK